VTQEVAVFECPGGCPPGECDTKGPWKEGRYPCAHCCGSGVYDGGYLTAKYAGTKPGDKCPYCKGDGLGGGFGTATCSKCGQSAIDRAMWEGP
jgi:hypothetical protein